MKLWKVLTATSCGGGIIYKYITTSVTLTMYVKYDVSNNVMHIHLPGKHYDVNLFHPQAFVLE